MLIPLRFAREHPFVTLGIMIGALPFSIGAVVLAMGGASGAGAGAAALGGGLAIWTVSGIGLARALRPTRALGPTENLRVRFRASLATIHEVLRKVRFVRGADGGFRGTEGRYDRMLEVRVEADEGERGVVLRISGPAPLPSQLAERFTCWNLSYEKLDAACSPS